MLEKTIRIHVGNGTDVSGILSTPEECRPQVTPGLILAHGSNGDMNHPLLLAIAHHLASTGAATVLRFNFPFAERGSTSPDTHRVLDAAYRRAHDALADDPVCPPGRIFLAGKSLGAVIAADLVSRHHEGEGLLAAGLIFLGYPLHAPGRKDRLHLEPLRRIGVPSLFVIGTRDSLCDLDLIEPVINKLEVKGTLVTIEGGDHSYRMPKSTGLTQDEVYARIADHVAGFLRGH